MLLIGAPYLRVFHLSPRSRTAHALSAVGEASTATAHCARASSERTYSPEARDGGHAPPRAAGRRFERGDARAALRGARERARRAAASSRRPSTPERRRSPARPPSRDARPRRHPTARSVDVRPNRGVPHVGACRPRDASNAHPTARGVRATRRTRETFWRRREPAEAEAPAGHQLSRSHAHSEPERCARLPGTRAALSRVKAAHTRSWARREARARRCGRCRRHARSRSGGRRAAAPGHPSPRRVRA